jgi:lipopolysaccharide/colanic/teichoic acid biosynthesis glycosyltransferase
MPISQFVGILKRLMDKLLHGWQLIVLNHKLIYVAMAKNINYHRRCVNNY